jgi:hypothetical protein
MIEQAFYALLTVLLTYGLVRGSYVVPKHLATSPHWKWSWALPVGFGILVLGGFVGMSWGQDESSDCEVEFPGAVAAPADPQMAKILRDCHKRNSDAVNSHVLAVVLVLGGAAAAGIRAGRQKCADEAPMRLLQEALERAEGGQRAMEALTRSMGAEEVERVLALVQGMLSELDALGIDHTAELRDLDALRKLYTRHTGKTPPSLAFHRSSAT